MKVNNTKAFTLIEVVIVLAIIGVLLPVVFSILLTVTRQQTKIFRLTEAKQQGDFALAFMKARISEHGTNIYQDDQFVFEACSDSIAPNNAHSSQTGNEFYIKKRDTADNYLLFYTENYPIGDPTDTSNPKRIWFSDTGAKEPLTTDNVRITNFDISCYRRTTAALPFVIISFTIYYKTNLATARPEDIAVLNYKGIVKLQ